MDATRNQVVTLLAAVHHTPHTVKCPTGAKGWGCSFMAGIHGQAVAGGTQGTSSTALLVLAGLVGLALVLFTISRRSRNQSR